MSIFFKKRGLLSNKQGFTLIELLVVISIIGIISAFTVINFRKGERTGRLQRSAQQVIQSLRKAQSMALSSVEYEGQVYDYYGVYVNKQTMPNSYYIFASINEVYNPTEGDKIAETVSLEDNIMIDSISTGTKLNITFVPPDAFVFFNPTVSEATITIKRSGGTCPQDCRYVVINDKGWMSIQTTP